MLKRSIGIGMLCVAGHAYSADIIVNTTEDVKKDDKECSLREAIEYVNLELPEEGHLGCGGKGSSSTIVLEKTTTYKLDSQIKITAALTLKTVYDSSFSNETKPGLNNATIKMVGKDNIFYIDDAKKGLVQVNLIEVNLQGCGQSVCATQGGLIFNNEYLVLDHVKLTDGIATQGGAIYNVGVPTEAESVSRSLVEIKYSLFEKNKADEGAIIYSRVPQFRISNSVFRENETNLASAANIYSAADLDSTVLSAFPFMSYKIANSTFYKNTGWVINVRDGIGLNSLTVIGNTAGIKFNAPAQKAYLANSIVLGNPYPITQDDNCSFISTDKTYNQNNIVANSCTAGDSLYPNDIWTGTQLIAGDALDGKCKTLSQDPNSLLCPYFKSDKDFLGYFRPRILMSYNKLAESLIINKGKFQADSTSTVMGCERIDQRDNVRDEDNDLCDRGAIEIIMPSTIGLVGEDLLIGETAQISIVDHLSDSDLVPKEECDAILGKNPTGEAWQAGCLQVVQTQTPSKGKLTINEDGTLVYTPQGDWHGADIFKIRLVTSSTRFNKTKPYMEVNVNVVQAPKNAMESKSVNTSGGSVGFFSLFGILGLVGLRRYKK
ncbi:rhombotarget A [Acinetobacter sp. ANC 4169]|uniref:rhombotarget A n=1 Tax=Acinetobacter sp. ANC 4169 TaxID=1977879 RepID=UPI000A334CD8|nr:rhombotarget A [Acinetobacter sp. ANC 4169]OTG73282.1 rhombotarget A [Acinetobacter sp. ANC 4169]